MKPMWVVLLAVSLTAACAPRAFTRGQYGDPAEISMLGDDWNQNDMQLTARDIVSSIETWVTQNPSAEKPVVILETFKNRTTEHIDTQALYDHIKTALIHSGKFTFLDKAARPEIAQESDYQNNSGYVDPNQAVATGKQKGAQFLLGGVITSTIQQVGPDKVAYYKTTFELTSIETTEIVWTDQKEIAKHFKKKSVGF
ncbi:MAG: penicillin-binding protein activator LpoB [Candidatus Latescibacteria bacterium]|nr:penicillin-binding protein activator LpoB [Candidatus Latescibacterota bacterium]